MPPYRVAIVGTGGIASAHAEALSAAQGTTGLARVELVAAVDVDLSRAEAFAKTWSMPVAGTTLTDVLAAEPIDLVHICTPPGSHVALAAEALAAGATAVVEKPIAVSLAAVDELLAAETEAPGSVAVISQHRFGSGALRLRGIVEAGAFGRPLIATCHTQWYRDAAYFAVPWRGSFEVEGGGPTMGHGIHQMDLLLATLGEWSEVTAIAARTSRETGTEDVSMALVRFESDVLASVVNSVVSPREVSSLRFDFEHATVELEHLYGYSDNDFTVTGAPGFEDEVAAAWAVGPAGRPSSHGAQVSSVLDALDAGETPPVPLRTARATLELVAAIYRSAFTRRPVLRGEISADDPFTQRMDGNGAPWA
ncbi:oxidoreductase domain protein [Kribbella flavida DSM 17836]|uniref:Oxidoreductase domain protein n=1 Tax=Kribbella flavida (strain DSM 17836 / JCM 10339 / NBRC 14399) TaxID=479435 RepID=D2PV63_KRIFD|nr:Gfo/Idh/MocA family oxidoreductase [Kribbella flavida]ADB33344.1 oxidoreductase domain protein [Kribbella flavida DSM 17836]